MRIKLDSQWIKRLLQVPESGMGHQRVDVSFINGRELKNVMVFNAEDLEVPDEFARVKIKELRFHEA